MQPPASRQLWEIDENLMRAELSPTEMVEHLAGREEIWAQREVSRQLVAKPEGGRPTGFASETSEKTGVSKRAVQRALSRAKPIPVDVRDEIKGTKRAVNPAVSRATLSRKCLGKSRSVAVISSEAGQMGHVGGDDHTPPQTALAGR